MSTPNRRRHRRIPARVPVYLISGEGTRTVMTEDISYSGLFVRTDSPRPLRQLLKMSLTTPDTGDLIELLAMNVYIVTPEQAERQGRAPGMGMNLYGLNEGAKKLWWDFVDRTTALYDSPGFENPPIEAEVEPIRRRFPRHVAGFRVRVKTTGELVDMLTRDISVGGTFLRTEVVAAVGTPVDLDIVHPTNHQIFRIHGQVIRVVEGEPSQRGLAVRFDAIDAENRARFRAFIESGLPELDLSSDLVVESKDQLLL